LSSVAHRPASASAALPADDRGTRTLARGGRLLRTLLTSVAAIAVFLLCWELLPRLGLIDRTFVPPFSTVVKTWWQLLTDGVLWEHTRASMVRALGGFAISIAIAVPLGLLIGWYTLLADLLNPLLELFRNTAPLALLPVFVLILGIGETSKIGIIVYACTWPILLGTISGVRTVDPLLVKSARSLGIGSVRLFQKVILPAAVPSIFTGIRMAGAFSVLILVAAEMVGAKAGLGYLINYSQQNFAVPQMYAAIITISLIGLVINAVLLRVERHFSTWRLAPGAR
jgi:NitT/TauT family transport system permease protein